MSNFEPQLEPEINTVHERVVRLARYCERATKFVDVFVRFSPSDTFVLLSRRNDDKENINRVRLQVNKDELRVNVGLTLAAIFQPDLEVNLAKEFVALAAGLVDGWSAPRIHEFLSALPGVRWVARESMFVYQGRSAF